MKKKKVLFAACILLAGCNSSPNEESTKGIVTDASMNTVTIVTEKSDTLSFSTMNADKANQKLQKTIIPAFSRMALELKRLTEKNRAYTLFSVMIQ